MATEHIATERQREIAREYWQCDPQAADYEDRIEEIRKKYSIVNEKYSIVNETLEGGLTNGR